MMNNNIPLAVNRGQSKLIQKSVLATLVVTVALGLGGCAVPKVAELQKTKELPVAESSTAKTSAYEPVEVSTYFKDAHLQTLLDKAIAQNPGYLEMQQRVDMANSQLKMAKLALLPSLSLSADASGTHFGKYTMEGVGNYDTNFSQNIEERQKINTNLTPNYFVGGKVSWEIDVWGKLRNMKKSAQFRYLSSQEGMRLLKARLLTDVANLYYELLALDKQAKIYTENLKIQQRALEIISAQRSVGKATELAVQQFQAQNSNILAESKDIALQIVQTERALLTLLGEYDGKIDRSADFTHGSPEVLNQQVSAEEIIHKRPDVSQAYYEYAATRADAKSARAAFFPSLGLGAYAGYNAFSGSTLFDPGSLAWQVLGGLTLPVFNQGKIKQQFLVADRTQRVAFINYQNSVTTAYNELQSLLYRTQGFQEVLTHKSNEINHLEIAVDVANDLYRTGYANYLEIISAQKAKLQAELDYVTIQRQNATAIVDLYKALGGNL